MINKIILMILVDEYKIIINMHHFYNCTYMCDVLGITRVFVWVVMFYFYFKRRKHMIE